MNGGDSYNLLDFVDSVLAILESLFCSLTAKAENYITW